MDEGLGVLEAARDEARRHFAHDELHGDLLSALAVGRVLAGAADHVAAEGPHDVGVQPRQAAAEQDDADAAVGQMGEGGRLQPHAAADHDALDQVQGQFAHRLAVAADAQQSALVLQLQGAVVEVERAHCPLPVVSTRNRRTGGPAARWRCPG